MVAWAHMIQSPKRHLDRFSQFCTAPPCVKHTHTHTHRSRWLYRPFKTKIVIIVIFLEDEMVSNVRKHAIMDICRNRTHCVHSTPPNNALIKAVQVLRNPAGIRCAALRIIHDM